MTFKKIGLLGLGLAALFVGCTSPTSDSGGGTPPKTEFYLYSTAGTADLASSHDAWSSGTTIDDAFTDTTYSPVIKLTNGSGWGPTPVAAIGFNDISPAGTLLQYTTLQFKIKATGFTTITVKFPTSTVTDAIKQYTIANGTALSGGWTQITVPLSDFVSIGAAEQQVGIFEWGTGTILLTDIAFSGTAEVTEAGLTAAIAAAQTLLDGTDVGTGDGEVSQAAHNALASAIETAEDAATATWAQINSALTALGTAVETFTDAIIHFAPSDVPAAPSVDAEDVISLYNSSATYTDIGGVTWNPDWGQSGTISDYSAGGTTVKHLHLVNYQGVNFDGNVQDLTGYTKLHISYWTHNGNEFKVYAINAAGGSGDDAYAADTNAGVLTGTPVLDTWTDLEITLPEGFHPNIQQLKFDTGAGDYYFDNIYFH